MSEPFLSIRHAVDAPGDGWRGQCRGMAGGFAGTALGPLAQGRDLAVHQLGQRHGAGHGIQDVLGAGLPAFDIGG